MTKRQLISIARGFRNGLLAGSASDLMCAVVSHPLAGYLSAIGVDCSVKKVDLKWEHEGRAFVGNHVFISLPDGRVLDPTASQFDGFPDVYVGKPKWIHGEINRCQ